MDQFTTKEFHERVEEFESLYYNNKDLLLEARKNATTVLDRMALDSVRHKLIMAEYKEQSRQTYKDIQRMNRHYNILLAVVTGLFIVCIIILLVKPPGM